MYRNTVFLLKFNTASTRSTFFILNLSFRRNKPIRWAPIRPTRQGTMDAGLKPSFCFAGEKTCPGVGVKEQQRRSDPGGSSGPQPGAQVNHQNPSHGGASLEDEQQIPQPDDADHAASESQSCASSDVP